MGSKAVKYTSRLATSHSHRVLGVVININRMSHVSKNKPEQAKLVATHGVTDATNMKWIGLEKIIYLDPNGQEREWESAVRKTRSSGGIDGVGILAILRHPDQPDRIVLQKQFRPPVNGVCIEMPAGLVDEGETIEQAALRELKEETGYSGKIISKSPTIFNDPGFTNTNLSMVLVEIDETLPENQNPVNNLEANEFIECFTVTLKDFPDKMLELDRLGYKLDSRVDNIAQGIRLAKQFDL
ncbi:ADP-ribose diphosphatase Ecym_3461 [Eremothecium cymbalariae DBVPG|uniref:Nudix hydrolase domain-containing protein n=1 Tax=Eremothecium cymbalariae (strain CBS 270.75 / DBVPG 7215 / KCTC 17166 / NRRL Y-17582) TaxID=931890 RepID=G8JS26_ERECY|nr:Hypothetical protein Ecym_3461 [Eremothecium cymbalariae DBVPG\